MRGLNSEAIEKYMRVLFIALSMIAVGYNLWDQSWEIFWSAVMTLILFVLPTILAKRAKIRIPAPFQIIILLFIFCFYVLGRDS